MKEVTVPQAGHWITQDCGCAFEVVPVDRVLVSLIRPCYEHAASQWVSRLRGYEDPVVVHEAEAPSDSR